SYIRKIRALRMSLRELKGKNESTTYKTKRAIEIQDSIRQILFQDWDPISISDNPNLTDEYDAYIAPIYRILIGSRSKEEIVKLLDGVKRSNFGISQVGNDELQPVANKLLELNVKIK
ncbi:MAG: hypothetical protein ACR2MG_20825, partial [Pyrinomonadaceae bacterium]